MKITKAVVPVAGIGTRLLPTTKALPKEMLPLGRLPIIHRVVEELIKAGISEILFVTNRSKGIIENHFDDYSELLMHLEKAKDPRLEYSRFNYADEGIQFFSVRQPIVQGCSKPSGTGGAVLAAEKFVNNHPFVVAFGDSVIYSPQNPTLLERLIKSHEKNLSECTIASYEVAPELVDQYGVLEIKSGEHQIEDCQVTSIIEKPNPEQTNSRLVISARYVFSPTIFAQIRRTNPTETGEIYLTDAISGLIQNNHRVRTVKLNVVEKRYDIGNHLAYFKSFIDYALTDNECREELVRYLKQIIAYE